MNRKTLAYLGLALSALLIGLWILQEVWWVVGSERPILRPVAVIALLLGLWSMLQLRGKTEPPARTNAIRLAMACLLLGGAIAMLGLVGALVIWGSAGAKFVASNFFIIAVVAGSLCYPIARAKLR